MASLRLLLRKNQTNLDRLRVRSRYCRSLLSTQPLDFHKQYGPYGDFWDDWFEQAVAISSDLTADVSVTEQFVTELRDFIAIAEETAPSKNVTKRRTKEMRSLAKEALACQDDMLQIADERIACHKDFTHQLLIVEAIDELSEE
jgi:hypothetical protein